MWQLIPAALGLLSQNNAKKQQRKLEVRAGEQAVEQEARQREQQAILDEQRRKYEEFKFTNPYANIVNRYEGLENQFEDLTVSQEAARFQIEQGAQQRANIMAGLRGAAGSSGVAALAQSLANQGILQARQVSADISQQEARNAQLAAQGGMRVQQLQAQGAQAADLQRMQGASQVQQAEMQRQATLLGMAFQGAAGAERGLQQAYANQMSMGAASAQISSNMAGTLMGISGDILAADMAEDGEIDFG